jgi:predicted nucleic acid-binding protein
MTPVFADTFYFLALLIPADSAHSRAVEFGRRFTGTILTTGWVLTEVFDAMSHPVNRILAVNFIEQLRATGQFQVVPLGDELAAEGLRLFADRPDKHWSLTDCISFVVMQREGIADALTGDRHFEQAGFRALLA